MTTSSDGKDIECLWNKVVSTTKALTNAMERGVSSFAIANDVLAAQQRFQSAFEAAALAEQGEATLAKHDQIVEAVRSAHAALHGVVNIGSFEQRDPCPEDHDASCSLIWDAYETLRGALGITQA